MCLVFAPLNEYYQYYRSCQLDVTSFVVIHDFTDGFSMDSHLCVPVAVDRSCDWLILSAILVGSTEVCKVEFTLLLHLLYFTKDLPECDICCL